MSINPNLSARARSVESKEAIRPTLSFTVEIQGNNNYKIEQGEVELYINLPTEGRQLLERNAVHVGERTNRNGAEHVFDFQLTHADLDRIEQSRGGDDLKYRLETSFSIRDRSSNWGSDGFTVNGRVAQSDWTNILADLGYGEIQTIEVYFPDSPAREHFEKAWDHVTDADEQFARGNWGGTLVDCRKAIEVVDNLGNAENMEDLLGGEKWNRMGSAKGYLRKFTSLGPHSSEGPGHEVIKRRDAQAALLMTKALVNYVGDAMRERDRN